MRHVDLCALDEQSAEQLAQRHAARKVRAGREHEVHDDEQHALEAGNQTRRELALNPRVRALPPIRIVLNLCVGCPIRSRMREVSIDEHEQ